MQVARLKLNSKPAIARACGVNLTTVTLALNNHPRVAERTRQGIQAEARRIGYVPNHAARQLAQSRFGRHRHSVDRVGFVLFGNRGTLHGIYITILTSLAQEVSAKGGTLLFMHESPECPSRLNELSRSGAVDGLALVGDVDDKTLLKTKRTGLPFVIVGDYHGSTPVHQATADFTAMGRLAVRRLVELGHRRIGFIGPTMNYVYQCKIRDGVKAGLAEFELPADAEMIQTYVAREDLMTPLGHLLALKPRPTALILGEPKEVAGLLVVLKECGMKAPDDISLVSCEVSDALSVPGSVTYVDVLIREVGAAAAALLREVAAEPGCSARQVLIAPRLVEGGSDRNAG